MVNLKLWQITLINIRISFSPQNYKKKLKRSLVEGFHTSNWHFTFFLHIFPLLFGFYQLIWSRYKSTSFEFFFEKNIPGMFLLKEDISWETFEKIKSKMILKDDIEKIHIYNDSILIEVKKNSPVVSVGSFLNKNSIPTRTKCELNSVQDNNQNFINSKFFLIKENTSKGKTIVFSLPLNLYTNDFSLKKKTLIKNSIFSNFKNLYYSLDELPGKLQKIESKRNNLLSEKEKIVQQEIANLFYKRSLPPPEWFGKDNQKLTRLEDNKFKYSNISDISSKDLIQLLLKYNLMEKTIDFYPRVISEYQYVDSDTNKVFSIILQQLFQSKNILCGIKINLPPNITPFFQDFEGIPSVLINNRLITDRKDNFFIFNIENDIKEKKKIESDSTVHHEMMKNEQELRSEKTSLQKLVIEEISSNDLLNNKELDDSDPDSWFLLLNTYDTNEYIPILEEKRVFNLSKEKILKNKTILTNADFFPYFSFLKIKNIKKEKIVFNVLPTTESFSVNSFENKYYFGNNYTKLPSLEKNFLDNKNKRKIFQFDEVEFLECWEPIHKNSWMMISQFSIGLFILKILQDLYKDYGKELLYYVLQFAASLGIDVKEIKEQFLSEDTDTGYRLIKKVGKSFKDIAGIDGILPQVSELVWFLRNSGRSKKFRKSIPKGILLVGPPGTGKTLIVQAIAGEAEVPVLVESGSLLTDPEQRGKGIQRLKKLFEDARQLSPCIVFIDEVDTLGEKRQQIIQPAMGDDEIIESMYASKALEQEEAFIPKPLILQDETSTNQNFEYDTFRLNQENQTNLKLGQIQQKNEAKKTRLSLLMQFLVEMDGLNKLEGVIVIGATNRPNVLDPALIRPGRFDQILNLELPGKNKRVEILKLYSEKLKTEKNISWNYLANRTIGFSAADLAAVMNESAIQAILNNCLHTVETIEKGIDLITSYTSKNYSTLQKNSLLHNKFYVNRLAYYQAGQAILHYLLPEHFPAIVFYLWPRQKNTRHKNIQQNSNTQLKNRYQLETQIIGLYAGKAAEFILLYGNINFTGMCSSSMKNHQELRSSSFKYWESNIGIEDLSSASFLSYSMIDKWFLYSKTNLNRKNHQLIKNRNFNEYKEQEKREMMKLLDLEFEDEISVEQISKLSRFEQSQQLGYGPWWQIQTTNQISEIESFYAEWFRIYLPDPEESTLNIEWVPPDEYFHTNSCLKPISKKSNVEFNEIYKIERDYIYQGLILNCFNMAFSILDQYREFLDFFGDYLILHTVLREDKINFILKNQVKNTETAIVKKNTSSACLSSMKNEQELHSSPISVKLIENQWGYKSRRKISRFINLEDINFTDE
uniref:Cell division protein n=1 Tax=Binuclearia lauterbornii TaxID=3087189 RepID=A0A097KPB4_9CHLO|nr:cell division protein [Binuclearia lauterbornii]AIT95002.1 cell division protein [Binuclearia lauterbornii]